MMVHTSCRVDKFAKHKIRSVIIRRCARKNRDRYEYKAANGPDKGTTVQKRQEGVHESIDDERCDSEGDIDEELVPALRLVALARV